MIDLGTVRPGSTIRIPFSSYDKDDGSSVTMTNFSTADVLVYKDGGTTERASTAGFTATTDFDAKTGKHLAIIDLADNTTAGFFAAGSEYLVALDAVTVDGVTVGGWIARFRIGYAAALLDTTIASLSSQTSFTLTAGPAEDDALNGMWALIHDVASAVQVAWVQILDYVGSTKTVTLATGATFTAAASDNISIMGPMPLQAATIGRTLAIETDGMAHADVKEVEGADATNQIRDAVVDDATRIDASAMNTLSGHDPGEAIMGATDLGTGSGLTSLASASALTALAGVFTGITSLAQWLGLIAGKQTGNSTARTELRATGAGSGTYDETTDSQEAARDNMGTAQTGDAFARLGAPAGASIAADIATRASQASVDVVDGIVDELKAAGITRSGTAQAGAAGTITLDAGASAVDDYYNNQVLVITGGTGAGQARILSDYVGSTKVATVNGNWATNPDNTSTFAVVPFGAVPGASAPTAAQVADAVWQEPIADHSGVAGSTAEQLAAAGAAGDPWATALPGSYTSGQAGKIIGDNLNATVSSRATAAKLLSYFQSALRKDVTVDADIGGGYDDATDSQEALRDRGDAAWTTATGFSTHSAADVATAVWAAGSRTLTSISGLGLALATKLTKYVQLLARKDAAIATDNGTELTEINADGGSGAGAYANSTDALEANRDNQQTAAVAALSAYDPPTKAELDAAVAPLATAAGVTAVEADTQDLQARLPATLSSGRMRSDVEAIAGAATAATKLAAHAGAVLLAVINAGSTTTAIVFKTIDGATPSATDDFYNGCVLVMTSGPLAGQRTSITDYVGSTKTATVVAMTGAPAEDATADVV